MSLLGETVDLDDHHVALLEIHLGHELVHEGNLEPDTISLDHETILCGSMIDRDHDSPARAHREPVQR